MDIQHAHGCSHIADSTADILLVGTNQKSHPETVDLSDADNDPQAAVFQGHVIHGGSVVRPAHLLIVS